MFIVAGPPGSGKPTLFPVSAFGVEYFNADDRAARLNGGSWRAIPATIRSQVNQEFERFVEEHIRTHTSFAIETTLRGSITFEQADRARAEGFFVSMEYIGLRDVGDNIERVAIRADAGGHSAPDRVLRAIHKASLANLPRALRDLNSVALYDNSNFNARPALIMEAFGGSVVSLADHVPPRVEKTLEGTEFRITERMRAEVRLRSGKRGS
jgi:predicted ABC-type ATPase